MLRTQSSAVWLHQGFAAYNKQICWLKEPLFLREDTTLFNRIQ